MFHRLSSSLTSFDTQSVMIKTNIQRSLIFDGEFLYFVQEVSNKCVLMKMQINEAEMCEKRSYSLKDS